MENNENVQLKTPNTLERESGYYRNMTTTISLDDWKYAKEKGLKFNVLLMERIAQVRAQETGAIVENVQIAHTKIENLAKKLQFVFDYANKKGFGDDMLKEWGKLDG